MKLGVLALVLALGLGTSGAPRPILFAANRTPSVTGEIYRVGLDGSRLDLSRSAFQDTSPAVSPDGKEVAFFSERGAPARRFRVFVVGSDGGGLRGVSGLLSSGQAPQLAWAPDGRTLAAVVQLSEVPFRMGLYLLDLRGGQRLVARSGTLGNPAWSPDGLVLLVTDELGVRAVSPAGKTLWAAASRRFAWSARNAVAIYAANRVRIYDEFGQVVASFPGAEFAWAPGGARIAIVRGNHLDLRTATGELVTSRRVTGLSPQGYYGLAWADANRLAIGGLPGDTRVGLDFRTGRRWSPPATVFGERSPDGSLVADFRRTRALELVVSRPDGSDPRVLLDVTGCFDDGGATGVADLQWAPDGRSLVYQSYCPEALDNLYAVSEAGGSRRLTSVVAEQASPAWSPDGRRIAYSRSAAVGLSCKGCPASLWVADAGGTHGRQLTHPDFCTFDQQPSWSPDGREVLISRSSCSDPSALIAVDPLTGHARNLHIEGTDAAWGPSRIAYVDAFHGPTTLWTAAPDGTDRRRIATEAHDRLPFAPAWSDGGGLAYLEHDYRRGHFALVIAGRRVALPFLAMTDLAWSPDGSRLAVTGRAPGTAALDVYTLRPDGSDLRRLTHDVGASAVSWR